MPSSRPRLEWIDLFRGLAVVGMVWTHAGNTFLEASLQKGETWQSLTYYHGLVAPAFFWVLGHVRGLAFRRQTNPRPAWPSVKRLLMIGLVGYAMHLPYGFAAGGGFGAPVLWSMFTVDVLQCLAVSGLLIVTIERLPRFADPVATVAFLLFVILAERAQSWRTGFIPLDACLTSAHGSLFPLFPWAGFALAGFLSSRAPVNDARVVIVAALMAFGTRHVPGLDWSVGFFLERLGWVMLLVFVTSTVLERGCQRFRRSTGWLYLAGRESLVVYVCHLALIHALPWPAMSMEKQIGATQPPWSVALIFLALLVSSLAAAGANQWRKNRPPRSKPTPA